jgi:hypothetical protein
MLSGPAQSAHHIFCRHAKASTGPRYAPPILQVQILNVLIFEVRILRRNTFGLQHVRRGRRSVHGSQPCAARIFN